ncbi:hypothetical protein LX36DRAFT_710078 [Colletotrichum falcatum]|nr:hypothetical protein LX36DRAFT_710078 [Colletotrichum falcatum]
MVAFRFLLALLPLAAAMPSSNALESNNTLLDTRNSNTTHIDKRDSNTTLFDRRDSNSTLVRRHCMAPKNCGAVVQNTACDYCCAKDVKPDSTECKAKSQAAACQTTEKKEGVVFACDAD